MRQTPAIVDTNVVVAGLLTRDAESPVARVLDGMLAPAFPFVISEALLAEYRTVLLRPKLRRLHRLTIADVETVLVDLAQHAIVLTAGVAPAAPEPGDQFLWNLLTVRPDLVLVTGDKRLLQDAGMHGRVISPRRFVDGA